MAKTRIETTRERNAVVGNIIAAMTERRGFLLLGHKNADEDCIASMVAFAILLNKFDKQVQIYTDSAIPDNVGFLANICVYNSIRIINSKKRLGPNVDTIIVCDTPKPSMMDVTPKIDTLLKPDVLRIEVDHHWATAGISATGIPAGHEASSSRGLVEYLH